MQVHYKASVPATTAGAISPVMASNGGSGGEGSMQRERVVQHTLTAVSQTCCGWETKVTLKLGLLKHGAKQDDPEITHQAKGLAGRVHLHHSTIELLTQDESHNPQLLA
jgi:hypothetical protein